MRWGAAALVAALTAAAMLSGCQSDGSEPVLDTLLPSIPAATQATGPNATSPVPDPNSSAPYLPSSAQSPSPTPALSAAATYRLLVASYQRARSQFFAAVSSGRPLSLNREHQLAATYLTALRRFATDTRSTRWPASARAAVAELLIVIGRQQSHLAAMTTAPSPSAFAERLADYGAEAARENRAVAAVARTLGE
jgi:hypothetical protein